MSIAAVKEIDQEWGEILFSYQKKEDSFPCYLPTKEIFNLDPDRVIRAKCAALVVLTPFASLARTVYYIGRVALGCLAEAYCFLDDQPSLYGKKTIREWAADSARSLYYGVKMTYWAVAGLLIPYRARLYYGYAERELNRRHHRGEKHYLAICFQPLATLPGEDSEEKVEIRKKAVEKLKRFIDIRNKMREAFDSCSCEKIIQAALYLNRL